MPTVGCHVGRWVSLPSLDCELREGRTGLSWSLLCSQSTQHGARHSSVQGIRTEWADEWMDAKLSVDFIQRALGSHRRLLIQGESRSDLCLRNSRQPLNPEPLHMLFPLLETLFPTPDIYMACSLLTSSLCPKDLPWWLISKRSQPPLHLHVSDSPALPCFSFMVFITACVFNLFVHCLLNPIRIKFQREREFRLVSLNNKHLLLSSGGWEV